MTMEADISAFFFVHFIADFLSYVLQEKPLIAHFFKSFLLKSKIALESI